MKLTVSGNVVTTQQPLIDDWCQQFPSHSAGGLVFGPEGMLYASGGDGASFTFTDYGQEKNPCGDPPGAVGTKLTAPTAEGGALRAQDFLTPADPQALNGSVIRVDPDTGAGVAGNPLSASADPNAKRHRSPPACATRSASPSSPGSSEIYVGDVGWGAWEEIDRIPAPTDSTVDNFGWPCYEGNGQSAGLRGRRPQPLQTALQHDRERSGRLPPLHLLAQRRRGQRRGMHAGRRLDLRPRLLRRRQLSEPPTTGALFFADYSKRCTWVMFPKNGVTRSLDAESLPQRERPGEPRNRPRRRPLRRRLHRLPAPAQLPRRQPGADRCRESDAAGRPVAAESGIRRHRLDRPRRRRRPLLRLGPRRQRPLQRLDGGETDLDLHQRRQRHGPTAR